MYLQLLCRRSVGVSSYFTEVSSALGRAKGGALGCCYPRACETLCCSVPRAVSCVGENLIKLSEARRKLENLPPTFVRHSMLLANNIIE